VGADTCIVVDPAAPAPERSAIGVMAVAGNETAILAGTVVDDAPALAIIEQWRAEHPDRATDNRDLEPVLDAVIGGAR
jgi:hypothetical protein